MHLINTFAQGTVVMLGFKFRYTFPFVFINRKPVMSSHLQMSRLSNLPTVPQLVSAEPGFKPRKTSEATLQNACYVISHDLHTHFLPAGSFSEPLKRQKTDYEPSRSFGEYRLEIPQNTRLRKIPIKRKFLNVY